MRHDPSLIPGGGRLRALHSEARHARRVAVLAESSETSAPSEKARARARRVDAAARRLARQLRDGWLTD